MRHSFVGVLFVAGLVIAGTALRSSSDPGPLAEGPPRALSGDLITHVTASDNHQVVTVIDPRQRVMAVYHVNRDSGQITPKSVRNFTWDLQMIEFNSGDPLPQDIRSGLQH